MNISNKERKRWCGCRGRYNMRVKKGRTWVMDKLNGHLSSIFTQD